MNNNSPAILKTLIAYAICVPLAIIVGYLLASESEVSGNGNWTWNIIGLFKVHPITWGSLTFALCLPLLLRWHHFLLVASWNLAMMLFFLPGGPPPWLVMVALSLGISVLHRALNNKARFIPAPQITWSLIFLGAVVIFTAELTGGIGLHSLGSEVMGGKRYIFLLVAILGYFALTAQRIPPQRAGWYVLFFFLGGFTSVIGDLANVMPSSLYFIFTMFPPSSYVLVAGDARYGGVSTMATFGIWLMLARYGVRGIFLSGRPWRLLVFIMVVLLLFPGGFRSIIIQCATVFLIQFFLERMHHTKLLPAFIFMGAIMIALAIPFASKLPFTFQRSLAFLPLHISPMARQATEGSTDWRLKMWKDVLPEVPGHLLLGKGYALSQSDYEYMGENFKTISAEDSGSALAGDYHNGPLSVILPLGIWGVIAILWFWIASLRALYLNHRFGDPGLRNINAFLLACFIGKILMFLIIFGSLYSGFYDFIGIIGLSISLNGGIRRVATVAPVQKEGETQIPAPGRPQLQPFYQR